MFTCTLTNWSKFFEVFESTGSRGTGSCAQLEEGNEQSENNQSHPSLD